jgi:hypothetical protein
MDDPKKSHELLSGPSLSALPSFFLESQRTLKTTKQEQNQQKQRNENKPNKKRRHMTLHYLLSDPSLSAS